MTGEFHQPSTGVTQVTKTPLFAYLDRRNASAQALRAMRGAPEGLAQRPTDGLARLRMSRRDAVVAWIAAAVLAAVMAIVLVAALTA